MPDEEEQTTPLKKQILTGLCIVLPVLLIVFLINRENRQILDRDPGYTTGTVISVSRGAKGEWYAYYTYRVGDSTYTDHTSIGYCPGCTVGTKVRVRYATGYPSTSELVH